MLCQILLPGKKLRWPRSMEFHHCVIATERRHPDITCWQTAHHLETRIRIGDDFNITPGIPYCNSQLYQSERGDAIQTSSASTAAGLHTTTTTTPDVEDTMRFLNEFTRITRDLLSPSEFTTVSVREGVLRPIM